MQVVAQVVCDAANGGAYQTEIALVDGRET